MTLRKLLEARAEIQSQVLTAYTVPDPDALAEEFEQARAESDGPLEHVSPAP